jgi:hypothetical protein
MVEVALPDYSPRMNNTKLFFRTGKAGLALGAVFLTTLTGCYVQGPPVESGQYAFVAVDDYVYYPGYEVYYSSSRRQYAYREGNTWVARPAPRGVSVDVLLASPSVKMDFHDSPAIHHVATVQKYPKNWKPPGPNQGQKENGKDDKHGENGGK